MPEPAPAGDWLTEGPGPDASDEAGVAWDVVRTLALWEADVWVPAVLDHACGEGTGLAAVPWTDAEIGPLVPPLPHEGATAVLVAGPEAVMVLVATLRPHLPDEELTAAMLAALDASLPGGRQAALVVVGPPGSDGYGRLSRAGRTPLADGRAAGDEIDALGWTTWSDLVSLAADLAEEADAGRADAVHRLVQDLQGSAVLGS